jgi:hypothetical protein
MFAVLDQCIHDEFIGKLGGPSILSATIAIRRANTEQSRRVSGEVVSQSKDGRAVRAIGVGR